MERIVLGLVAALCVAGCSGSGGGTQMKASSKGLSAKSQNGIVLGGSQYAVLSTEAVFTLTPPSGMTITSATWDFGDGITVTGAGPMNHAYFALGSYTILVTLVDSLGGRATLATKVSVLPYDESLLCLSYLTLSAPTTATAGQPTNVSVSVPPCLTNAASGYQWSYGDNSAGDVTTSAADTHTYASAGDYGLNVTITTAKGVFTLTGEISEE